MKMPKIAEIEDTPNPNAVKFLLREPITWGISRSYDNAEEAKEDPLAAALFAIEHVTNVFYVDKCVTITQDGKAHWPQLARLIAVPLREAPAAEASSEALVAAAAVVIAGLSPEDQERFDKINAMLDEKIRPYLRSDGGDLHVVGFSGNFLSVHLQGACGSCPSSISTTLISITNLLRTIEPEIEILSV
uniref:Nitrogen-fixing NifU-like protein n=1 Tax=Candidatus Nitrotoga fabula TaxID=2182327 RepID=A0A2X0QZE6_9PROT|nr:Nitrogen-fixing NifU-like protein [Candidatus Nitrotoga fabula]